MKLTLDKFIIFIFLVVSYCILLLPNIAYSQPGLPRINFQIKDENQNPLNLRDFIILKGKDVYYLNIVNEFSDRGSLSLGSHQIDLTLIYNGRVMKIVDSSFSENSFSSQIIFRPGVFEIDRNNGKTSNIKPTDGIPILDLLYVSNETPSFNKLDAQEALNWVCYTGNTNNFLFVLENFDKSKFDYNIALGQALIYNNHNLVPLLKNLGAEVKLIPQNMVIAICNSGDETSLQILIDGKVNFSFPTNNSYQASPLEVAISNANRPNSERIKIVKMLVNAGADVNLDPKYLVIASPNLELMKLLVETGLNTKAKYPYPYSRSENRFFLDEDQATVANEVLKNTLHAYFQPLDYEIQHLRYEKDYEEIQKKHREQLKVRTFETISFLVKNGADINLKFYFRKDFKETPLQIANTRQDKELSNLLIKLGAKKD